MKLHADNKHYKRRKSDVEAWEHTVDALAMSLCPEDEWLAYEKRMQQLAWRESKSAAPRRHTAAVRVFPVWKKYRQKALRVATLHQAVPVLKHLPLRISCFLGDVLFK